MKVAELKERIADLRAPTISHFDLESEGLKVRIDWQRPGVPPVSPGGLTVVRAPIAGTFYRNGQRDKPLEVGDAVTAGQALCVIEAGGTSNVIEAETAGEVAVIHAENGSRVEINAPLFEIRVKE
jgi:biotin carboxyl carrier protein